MEWMPGGGLCKEEVYTCTCLAVWRVGESGDRGEVYVSMNIITTDFGELRFFPPVQEIFFMNLSSLSLYFNFSRVSFYWGNEDNNRNPSETSVLFSLTGKMEQ